MDITRKDRILLINQYRILAALYPDEADHYNMLIQILENGYELFYSMIDEWICDDMPSEDGKFVLDILVLYRAIEDFKRAHPDSEMKNYTYSYFRGFDGNDETMYMAFARFLINEQGKFAEQQQYLSKNDSMNSHVPMIWKYRKMINKWEELGKSYQLSEENVKQIIKA